MNLEKLTAGIFAGIGSIYLIYCGEVHTGSLILMGMMAFFVGEVNGTRKTAAD